MSIKTSGINIINNPNKSFIQSIIIEPHKNQAEKAGLLFLMTEINQPNKTAEKIIFIISQLLEKNYYLNENIFLAEQLSSLKIESIFESALVKSNRELLEFIEQQKIVFNFKTLNIIVGLIYDEQIHFSSMGQNKSFLIKKEENSWQISDINPGDEEYETEELASGKIFSSIISGELPDKSYIVFSNPSLSQYLLSDEFVKIIGELKLEGATEQIKNYLKRINNYSNFCGLLIKNNSSNNTDPGFKYCESDLTKTEKNTEKLLTTPGSIDGKKIIREIGLFLEKINFIKKISKLKKIISRMRPPKKEKSSEISEHSDSKTKWKNKKILLIIVGLLLLFLIANIVFKNKEKSELLVEENVSSFEELINQKQNQIESALLYNNENRAKEIIEELKQVINSLTDKEKNKIKNYSKIEEKIEEQEAKIIKLFRINDPREIANFSIANNETQIGAISIITASNKIYALDERNNSIYLIDMKDNFIKQISKTESIDNNKIISANNKDNNSYFLSKNQIININEEEKISFININIENREKITSFDIYNNRPYLLNQGQKQIYRYEQMSKDSLNNFNNWIKDNSDLEPSYIVTDYSIYILNKNGSVYKFLEGKKQDDFNIEKADPPIDNADILRVGNKYIYVIDKNNKRIVVYSKETGQFINQYQIDKLNNIKDVIIDENKNKAYILNDNIVYSIDLIFY